MLTVLLSALSVLSFAQGITEEEVKAAYIYNFALFTEWPANTFVTASAPIVVCTVGDTMFNQLLSKTIGHKKIGERGFEVRRVDSVEQAKPCHVLYVGAADMGRVETLVAPLQDRALLTIGDSERFVWRGGVFGFRQVEGRVRYIVNLKAAQRAGLVVSSQLLKLSTVINVPD